MMKHSPPTPKDSESRAGSTWLSKILSPLNLFLLLGTTVQLGLHFWPASSFIYGVRVDYLSPTLYLIDIVIFISLFLSTTQHKWNDVSNNHLSLFLLLTASNLIFSQTPLQSLLWWLRFGLYLFWASTLSVSWLQNHVKWLLIPLTLLFSLGLAQIIHGGSFQSGLYWLGERRFDVSQPGIALQEMFGIRYLRAYSLFSHPNIFAGWAIISILLISFFVESKLILATSYLLGITIIFITASRSAALSLLIIAFNSLVKRENIKICQKIIFAMFGATFITYLFLVRFESVIIPRLQLISTSLSIFHKFPVFGVGMMGSLAVYPIVNSTIRYLQPDHFSPTLIFSWLGLAGTLQLAFITRKFINIKKILVSLSPLLPIVLLDHYLLTSFSGMLIFALALRSSYLIAQLD